MTALGNVISWQKLDYDFAFHKQAFPTDVVTLVLSEGKSILKVSGLYAANNVTVLDLENMPLQILAYFLHSLCNYWKT